MKQLGLDKNSFAELVSGSFSLQHLIQIIKNAEDKGNLLESEVLELMENIKQIILKMATILHISSRAKARRSSFIGIGGRQ